MGTEYELKYRAAPAQQAAIRQAFSGEEIDFSMQTTYYDTADGILSARRYTLRRRLENGICVYTLKTSAKDGARGEWEVRCPGLAEALPPLTRQSGISLPRPADLVPICGARFTRIAKFVTFPGGSAELALDRGALIGGGREMPLCEVELELKSGSREALDAFGVAFQRKFGLEPEPESKFRRAIALARGEKYGRI